MLDGGAEGALDGDDLAQARLTANLTGFAPILLLDEVAAHFDHRRRQSLFDLIDELGGQAFMTGTDRGLFEALGARAQFFTVEPVLRGKLAFSYLSCRNPSSRRFTFMFFGERGIFASLKCHICRPRYLSKVVVTPLDHLDPGKARPPPARRCGDRDTPDLCSALQVVMLPPSGHDGLAFIRDIIAHRSSDNGRTGRPSTHRAEKAGSEQADALIGFLDAALAPFLGLGHVAAEQQAGLGVSGDIHAFAGRDLADAVATLDPRPGRARRRRQNCPGSCR